MSKGYSSIALVAQQVGRQFTTDQQAAVDRALEAVEMFIDDWGGVVYSGASGIVDEIVHVVPPKDTTQGLPGTATLLGYPVSSITSLRSAPGGGGVAVPYVVTDLSLGKLTIADYATYPYLWGSYATLRNVPATVREVATRYTAYLIRMTPGFGGSGVLPPQTPISAYSLGTDIRFEFRGAESRGSVGHVPAGIPPEIWPFLQRLHRWSLA